MLLKLCDQTLVTIKDGNIKLKGYKTHFPISNSDFPTLLNYFSNNYVVSYVPGITLVFAFVYTVFTLMGHPLLKLTLGK